MEDRVEAARKDLRSSDWSTRRDAARTLGQLGDRRAVPDLVAVLAETERTEDTAVMLEAVDALVKIGDGGALPILRKLAAWANPNTLHEEEVSDAAAAAVEVLEKTTNE